jgi:GNAT superfamily N-acetyltransferase
MRGSYLDTAAPAVEAMLSKVNSVDFNIEENLLRDLLEMIGRQNKEIGGEPGRPRIEIAQSALQVWQAAIVMARAFVATQDRGWLAWLSKPEIARIGAGDTQRAERKLRRTIYYLLNTGWLGGGILLLETANVAPANARVVRGTLMRKLPAKTYRRESFAYKYLVGGISAVRSYGIARALAADAAYVALTNATEETIVDRGIPLRCIRGGGLCVDPEYQRMRISSRLCAPFHDLADRNGLWTVIQSSNPDRNDATVFCHMGFQKIGDYKYGPSPYNNVGPYVINIMARKPR